MWTPAIDDESTHSPVLLQTEVTKMVTLYVTSILLEMSLEKGAIYHHLNLY